MNNYLRVAMLSCAVLAMLAAGPAMAQKLNTNTDDSWVTGDFGIGTATPTRPMHVSGNTTGVHAAMIRNIGNGSSGFRLRNSETNMDFVVNNGDFTIFDLGGAGVTFSIKASGDVGIGTAAPATKFDVRGTTRTEILEITGGADLSERFDVQENDNAKAEPGTVVCIDVAKAGALKISSKPYDRTVAGIVSGAGGVSTGLMMGQDGSVAEGAHAVALTGRVYCKVDASFNSIQPGDLLTTSPTTGHAMKVTDYAQAQGAIIGKAMTSLDGGQGLVLVLVTLQ